MVSDAMAATARGRNSGSSIVSAARATNRPLLVMEAKKFGPSPPPVPLGGQIFTDTAMMTGTAARTARPAQLRRRPKISHSSERRNRVLNGLGRATVAGATSSATDIEALPGQRHEQFLQIRGEHPEPAHRHPVVHQRGHHLLRRDV